MSPVNSNRVLISPRAFPVSLNEPTVSPATSLYISSNSCSAFPAAPVFLMILSAPSSTSENALIDAPPIATIPATTAADAVAALSYAPLNFSTTLELSLICSDVLLISACIFCSSVFALLS